MAKEIIRTELDYNIQTGADPNRIIISIKNTGIDITNAKQLNFLRVRVEELAVKMYEKAHGIERQGKLLNGTKEDQ